MKAATRTDSHFPKDMIQEITLVVYLIFPWFFGLFSDASIIAVSSSVFLGHVSSLFIPCSNNIAEIISQLSQFFSLWSRIKNPTF